MKILVTGARGFVGGRLLALAAEGRWPAGTDPVAAAPDLDVTDPASVRRTLDAASDADAVLHLAGLSSVSASWRSPEAAFRANTVGTTVLCHALAERGFAGRLVAIGSSDCYGIVPPERLPVPETAPLAPNNPYAASKQAAEAAALQWHRSHGLKVVLVRAFNHTGPGQRADFALPSFAQQIARVTLGRQDRILTGDLDVTRDFLWVDDVIVSYLDLLAMGEPGQVYNVCSGQEQNLERIVERMTRIGGCPGVVARDPARVRPQELRRSAGDPTRLRALTGRAPPPLSDDHLAALIAHWHRHEQTLAKDPQ